MRFFKTAGMLLHAQSIAAKFERIRRDQFSSIVYNLEHALHQTAPPEKHALGGDADLALKGYQIWIALRTLRFRKYLPESDIEAFTGLLISAGWLADREAVDRYCREFHKYASNEAEQAVRVAIPIAGYLTGTPDPVVWSSVAIFLPVFAIGTELAIASDFDDKKSVKLLQDAQVAFHENWKAQNNAAFGPQGPLRATAEAPARANRTTRLPDLGKRLALKGQPQKFMAIYPSFTIEEVSVVGLGRYCTTVVQEMDGELYCATVDFDDEILDRLMRQATPGTKDLVIGSLTEDPASVRRILLLHPINVGVGAVLGTTQHGLIETFIPLVIVEVF
jgi:hypothetical protein